LYEELDSHTALAFIAGPINIEREPDTLSTTILIVYGVSQFRSCCRYERSLEMPTNRGRPNSKHDRVLLTMDNKRQDEADAASGGAERASGTAPDAEVAESAEATEATAVMYANGLRAVASVTRTVTKGPILAAIKAAIENADDVEQFCASIEQEAEAADMIVLISKALSYGRN